MTTHQKQWQYFRNLPREEQIKQTLKRFPEIKEELEGLANCVWYLLEHGCLPFTATDDRCFTFPDGDTWHEEDLWRWRHRHHTNYYDEACPLCLEDIATDPMHKNPQP